MWVQLEWTGGTLPGCVALGEEPLIFSEPQFPLLEKEEDRTYSMLLCGLQGTVNVKQLIKAIIVLPSLTGEILNSFGKITPFMWV